MSVRRVVPDLITDRPEESRRFYEDVLGLEVGMDMGWIVTLVSRDNPTAQISLSPWSEDRPLLPSITVEVADVDATHDAAVAAGHEIPYPLTDEPWGVRRFFVVDPGGVMINVMAHTG